MRTVTQFRAALLTLALTATLAVVRAADLVQATPLRAIDAVVLMGGGLAAGAFIVLVSRGPRSAST